MTQKLLIKPEERFTEKIFIKFLTEQGITVKTGTKARGSLGICFKNRIDISRKAAHDKRLNILVHEYAHKIHYDLEKEIFGKGGTLEKLFKITETKIFLQELIKVTNFVDKNSLFDNFYTKKVEIKSEIKTLENIIKHDYPDFKKTCIFKPIDNYFKKNKSPAKYLLKYDNVKITQTIFRKEKFYSIKTLDQDFPEIPEFLRAYIRLKSKEREYQKFYRFKNKAEKYYKKPTELFARFVEGIFIDKDKIYELAPAAYTRFAELLNQNYYGNLKKLFELANISLD